MYMRVVYYIYIEKLKSQSGNFLALPIQMVWELVNFFNEGLGCLSGINKHLPCHGGK